MFVFSGVVYRWGRKGWKSKLVLSANHDMIFINCWIELNDAMRNSILYNMPEAFSVAARDWCVMTGKRLQKVRFDKVSIVSYSSHSVYSRSKQNRQPLSRHSLSISSRTTIAIRPMQWCEREREQNMEAWHRGASESLSGQTVVTASRDQKSLSSSAQKRFTKAGRHWFSLARWISLSRHTIAWVIALCLLHTLASLMLFLRYVRLALVDERRESRARIRVVMCG